MRSLIRRSSASYVMRVQRCTPNRMR
jgi:hypothetical protein